MRSFLTVFPLTSLLAAAAPQPGDTSFDARVSTVRGRMRSSCQALQAIQKALESDRAWLADTAAGSATAAVEGWSAVVDAFATRAHGPQDQGYLEAVRVMSLAADRLAHAARGGDDMSPAAADLAARVERAYELAL
jgi:hypothetical protein